MALELDALSFCGIKYGGGTYVRMYQLAGSSVSHDPAVSKVFLAGGPQYEASNIVRGLCQPVLDVATIPSKRWFTTAYMQRAFTAKTNGILTNSMGAIYYRWGSVGTAATAIDEVIGYFDHNYWNSFTLSGAGRGTPLSARVLILPCGDVTNPAPAAYDTGFDTFDYTVNDYHMSEGVSITGQIDAGSVDTLDNVLGWTLSIGNGLAPDTSISSTPVTGANPVYPTGYINGPIMATLTLIQRVGATQVKDSATLSSTYTFVLTSKDAGNTNTVTFTFRGIKPPNGGVVSLGLMTQARTYVGIATASGVSLAIT